MSYNFDIGNVLVPRCSDDSDFPVVLTRVLKAVIVKLTALFSLDAFR